MKTNNHISFDEKSHTYTNTKTGVKYESVTTFIKRYSKPFDSAYFSKYKAIERILGLEFAKLKSKVGYENVVTEFEKTCDKEILANEQAKVIQEWKTKSIESMAKGTVIHKQREENLLQGQAFNFLGNDYKLAVYKELNNNSIGAFPEMIVYSDKYQLAGQVDLILKNYYEIFIVDHKTTKDIKMFNKFQKMLYPINNLDDCEFNNYSLQLSLYAFMLEEMEDLKVSSLWINQILEGQQDKLIECNYLKQSVQAILNQRFREINQNINIDGDALIEELFPS